MEGWVVIGRKKSLVECVSENGQTSNKWGGVHWGGGKGGNSKKKQGAN